MAMASESHGWIVPRTKRIPGGSHIRAEDLGSHLNPRGKWRLNDDNTVRSPLPQSNQRSQPGFLQKFLGRCVQQTSVLRDVLPILPRAIQIVQGEVVVNVARSPTHTPTSHLHRGAEDHRQNRFEYCSRNTPPQLVEMFKSSSTNCSGE